MTKSLRVSWRENLLILALFAALTLLLTWPVVARLGSELAGGRDDLWVHQWTFWWVREALSRGVSPFFTTELYFPQGVALTSHNIAWANIAAWLPLQALFGRTAAYNLVFLSAITLNGFCMYLFSREVMRDRGAALVAGFIFGFWPYTLSHYDHANMMVVFWVPLALLLLTRLLLPDGTRTTRREAGLVLATAVTMAMIGITRWQLLLMSSPILLAYPLYLLAANRAARTRQTLLKLGGTAVLAVLLMAPLAAPLISDQFRRDFPTDVLLDEAVWGRTDLLAYFLPSINNSLWRAWAAPYYENFVVNQFYTPYLGYTTLLLAALGVLRRWRQTWLWLLLALGYFVLALGPELAVNGVAYAALPMPYRLVEDWFIMRLVRRPDRLNVFLSLPVAMMAGWGMNWLRCRFTSRRGRLALSTAVAALLLLAYWPAPFPTTALTVPRWYQRAAVDGQNYAVVDLPINDRSYDKWYMAYQTVHGMPLATGHVSRRPREATAFLDSLPLLADLAERDQLPDPQLGAVTEQLRLLNDEGITYLVIHKQFANEGLQAAWRAWLAVDPFYEDDELLVYLTAPRFGQEFNWAYPLGGNLGLLEAKVTPLEAVQGGVVRAALTWATALPPAADYLVCLRLRGADGRALEPVCAPPDPAAPASTWPGDDVRRGEIILPLDLTHPTGAFATELYLVASENGEPVGDTAAAGGITIHPFDPQNRPTAVWENGIALTGYTLETVNDALMLALYWQPEDKPVASYKVFVHVIDRPSGAIVAQHDAIPRDWGYPTDQWERGEIVRDVVVLPLAEVPPGTYDVAIGLYDELTGKRAQLASPAERGQDALILDSWEQK